MTVQTIIDQEKIMVSVDLTYKIIYNMEGSFEIILGFWHFLSFTMFFIAFGLFGYRYGCALWN